MGEIDVIFETCKNCGRPASASHDACPKRKLAILTCMDIRIDPYKMLGLQAGEAHIIRNAGAIVTDDVIRSLVLSQRAMGTRELMILAHTECGLLGLDEKELTARLQRETGLLPAAPVSFLPFTDLYECVQRQINAVRNHPWLRDIDVRGFIYDVKTGRITEVDHALLFEESS